MAHEVENMFSVNEVPWHGLGHIIQDAPAFEDVLKLAGLDWTVSMRDLHLADGTKVEQRAIVRDSDSSVLGYAGPRYQPLQNTDTLEIFRPFYDSGLCDFETAGSLKMGQKIWFLAQIKGGEMDIVRGDTVRKYLILSNGHDGNTAARIGFTPIRVVCANTLAIAHSSENSKLVRVFHSKKVLENLNALKDTINLANQSFEATAEQYRALAKREVNTGDLERCVDIVFYNGKAAETDREKIARETLYSEIDRLFQYGHGNDTANVRNTYWALYNGMTQYLSYDAGRTQDTRLDSLWFGANKSKNETALETVLEMAVA